MTHAFWDIWRYLLEILQLVHVTWFYLVFCKHFPASSFKFEHLFCCLFLAHWPVEKTVLCSTARAIGG